MRKAGQIFFTGETLRKLFGLPEDSIIRAIESDDRRDMFVMIVENEQMPEVPEGAEAPAVQWELSKNG